MHLHLFEGLLAFLKSVSCRSTLGARGFSCAVSGFGQVLKKLTPACGSPAVDEAPHLTLEKNF